MPIDRKLRRVCVIFLSIGLILGIANLRLAAQGTTGTILGTVTDPSGGLLPEAAVHLRNTGTNATVSVTTDAQGRYRLPDLPVGEYELQTEKPGFQTVLRQAITLNAGANLVVDFALPVGQVTQTVTVESDISQVETTSSTLSTVVEPAQMRDLPLNGRNFEDLIFLAPGVVNVAGTGAVRNSYIGNSPYWSVSGSRSNGQGELLDGTSVQDYQDRGSGSGILGTTLGVDAISEFQLMTNTYGAQFGGNGSVVNAVTRSGTNNLHGSGYEFLRNSAMDAKAFTDGTRQPFRKNQFGGTLGGPIKKDKMFFFVNYEGIRQDTGQTNLRIVPNANAMNGVVPLPLNSAGVPTLTAGCANLGNGTENCGAGSANAANFAAIQPYLNLYSPFVSLPLVADQGNGTQQVRVTGDSPAHEDYVVSRFDWTISEKDSVFVRDLFDNAHLIEPFYGSFPQWGNTDQTRNQYLTIGEKHIFSSNTINSLNIGVTRSFLYLDSVGNASDLLAFSGKITPAGVPVMDGALSPGSSIASVGPGQIGPVRYAQNKFSFGDDVFWTKGAHNLRFGGGLARIQTNGLHMFPGAGTWTFTSLTSFFTDAPSQFMGPCNYSNNEPGCVFSDGVTPLPPPSAQHDARETDFNFYVQDDWRVRPTVTVNVGLRYEPRTNPTDAFNQLYTLLPVPFGQTGNLPTLASAPPATSLTPETNYFLKNDSLHNFDPRIGVAWDPFKDHKTSIRAGYGIFHSIVTNRDYRNASFSLFPWTVRTVTTNLTFPTPFQSNSSSSQTTETNGTNPFNTTPYLQQWNLSIQREIMRNTVLTVAYVGSHGVHLIGQRDSNPPVPAGGLTQTGVGGIALTNGQVLWPSFAGENLVATTGVVTPSANAASPTGTVYTCGSAAGCTLATPNGQAIVDPATGEQAFSHVVQTSANGTFSIQSNTHLNPNFSYMNNYQSDLYSHYAALQVGLVRRMTNNLSAQFSYTYSSCIDQSSGDWTQEGGTIITNAYNPDVDRGRCLFFVHHNATINTLYAIPFKGNRLVSGWQIGGIVYLSTGGPFSVGTFSNGSTDIGTAANRADYNPSAPGCNSQPILPKSQRVTSAGVFYLNPACFSAPPPGEVGNTGRDQFIGPGSATVNMTLQKETKISERYTVQLRAEAFNLFNRTNYANPGASFQQGSSTSLSNVVSGSTPVSFGQITTAGTMRQLQLGLKVIF